MEKMLFSTSLLIATSSLYEAHTRLFKNDIVLGWASQVALVVKNPCQRPKRRRFDPWVRKIPWRRAWQLTLVLLPGKSHGQRSLAGYSPWGHKESDMTERDLAHTLF